MKNLKKQAQILKKLKFDKAVNFLNVITIKNGNIYLINHAQRIVLKNVMPADIDTKIETTQFLNAVKNDMNIDEIKLLFNSSLNTYQFTEQNYNETTLNFNLTSDILELCKYTAKDAYRPVLKCIHFGDDIASTDAHSLKWIKNTLQNKDNFNIDASYLNLLPIGEYVFSQNNDAVRFSNDFIEYECKTDKDKFPNYTAVIPQNNPINAILDKKEVLSALKKCELFYNKTTKKVVFEFMQDGTVKLNARDIDFGKNIDIELKALKFTNNLNNESLRIAFNSKFIAQALDYGKEKSFNIELSTPSHACIINNNTLIMPMLLHN